jgi:peptide/nickel transport system permease protein
MQPVESDLITGATILNPLLAGEVTVGRRRRGVRLWFFLRRSPLTVAGILIVLLVVLVAVFGSLLAPYPAQTPDYSALLAAPSHAHLFGTDQLGRDVFSRVLSGARYSILVSALVLLIGVTVGTAIGLVAGYSGSALDEALMRFTDIFLAFPFLVLAIALAATLGAGLTTTVIALGAVWWPWYARLVRAQVLTIRERVFVDAARASGVSVTRILWRHILPETMTPIIVQLSMDVGSAILAASSLSFIGLGAQPPTPEWGAMISDAQTYLREGWWIATFPGLAIALSSMGFNLLGDGLRDFWDPRTVIER